MTSCQHGKRRRVRGKGGFPGISLVSLLLCNTSARSKYKMTNVFFSRWCFFFLFCDGLRCCFEREKNNNVSTFCSRQLFLERKSISDIPLFTRHVRSKTHSSRDCFRIFYRIISSLLFLTRRRRKQNTFTQKKKKKKKKKKIKSSAKNVDELL